MEGNNSKTTFRINKIKSNFSEIAEYLDINHIIYDTKYDFPDAFIVDRSIDVTTWPIYTEGKIYVQSLSSMKPVYVLDPKAGENILDMCAAPGSKTTMIQSITNNKVNLTACELHKDRYEKLKYNLELQGANAYALNQNACDLNDMLKFDKILLDAPCTGSGTESFNESIKDKCIKSQKRLIEKASKLLKKGGILIYSTCSIFKEENEDIVDYAMRFGLKLEKIDDKNQFIKIERDDLFEGFFVAKLIK